MTVVGQAFVEVLPLAGGFAGALQKQVSEAAKKATAESNTQFATLKNVGTKAALGVAGAVIAVGAASVAAASNYQELTTRLVTGAGESEDKIGMVRQGILDMAPAVGTTSSALANGMFMIESAGFHGANGLAVLKAAAEGAKVGGADLSTVANGLTTVLTDYHLPAQQAASVTSMLIETVASGKTTMQDLAGSLSNVLPVAAAAHISFEDVAGALATMTGQGISAQQASQNVANTIRQLQAPSAQATALMDQFGISATDVASHLGQRGLSGTLDLLVKGITAHMGPAGLVLQGTLKQSQIAAQDAAIELKALPPNLQELAKQYMAGTISQTEWRKSVKGLGVDQRQLAMQFGNTVNQARGFADALKSGRPEAQTLSATLSQLLGGATGLNTALALTGPNMATYKQNLVNIYNAGVDAKTGLPTKEVQGFGEVTKDFSFQVDQAKAAINAWAIELGNHLLPILSGAIKIGQESVTWLTHHKDVAFALAGVIGGALTLALAAYTTNMIIAVAKTTAGFVKMMAEGAAWVVEQISQFTLADGAATVFGITMESVGAASMVALGGTILVIAAVAAGAYLLITHWKDVSAFFVGLWHDIERYATEAWDSIKGAVKPTLDAVTGAFHDFVGDVKHIFTDVQHFFEKWWPVLLSIMLPGLGIIITEIILHWNTLKNVTETVWNAISGAIMFVVRPLEPFFTDVLGAISAVFHLTWDALTTYITTVFELLRGIFQVGLALIEGILSEAWDGIKALVMTVWDGILTYLRIWWAILQGVVQVGWDLIKTIFTVALDLLEGKWGAAWTAIESFFGTTWSTIKQTLSTVWGDITGFFTGGLSNIEQLWNSTWGNVASTVSGVWAGISGAASSLWGTISSAFSSGITDVENILNNAFINPINSVLGVFGVKIQPFNTAPAPHNAAAPGSGAAPGAWGHRMESGGLIVNSPTVLVGEGGKGYPESVIPWDPAYRGRAHKLLAATIGAIGMPGLAGGGIWDSVTGAVGGALGGAAGAVGGAVSSVAGGAASAFKSALGWASSTLVGPALDAALSGASSLLGGVSPKILGQLAIGVIHKVADGIKHMLGAGGGHAIAGMIPSGSQKQLIAAALGLAGQPDTAGNEAAVNLIVTHESGWNPSAVNLTDINAQHGDPSRGLMQTIGSTFAEWAIPGYNSNINDPLSNLIAGIRYAVSRYHSLGNVPGVAAVARGGAYVGYDSGGWLMPGFTPVWNGTGQPERVISPTGAGPGGGITFAPGAVQVAVTVEGAGGDPKQIAQFVEQGVQQGVTRALGDIMTVMGSKNLAGRR